ncbi:hypothetical protein MBAV_005118 [Candidatus Magnetobacterium bavaricum]|uniref:Uncharacterized protein n=1 Tax=Candidatus Magnetobacterium bavaricum TaxID=29290 RepID=A0A0F3GLG7_9BACT|nr:hypothetical protein MBAV_005118 [Candidatus Magnetobacterium bavaricum]
MTQNEQHHYHAMAIFIRKYSILRLSPFQGGSNPCTAILYGLNPPKSRLSPPAKSQELRWSTNWSTFCKSDSPSIIYKYPFRWP